MRAIPTMLYTAMFDILIILILLASVSAWSLPTLARTTFRSCERAIIRSTFGQTVY